MKYIIAFDSYVRIDNKTYQNVTKSSMLRLQYTINMMTRDAPEKIMCRPVLTDMVGWEAYVKS